jgi:hypothetical protein
MQFLAMQKFSLDISGIEEAGETIDFSADIRKDIAGITDEVGFQALNSWWVLNRFLSSSLQIN